MTRLLIIVSSAHTIGLADGSEHATGYWAEEVLEPYERFLSAGADLVIATPEGRPPRPDPWSLEPFFHYPQADEDFMLSVLRSFARYADEIRVTFTHFSELNLIVLRRIFLALIDTGMERRAARQLLESAAQRSWRACNDFIDVLADVREITERLSPHRLRAIKDEVWRESSASAERVAGVLAAIPGLKAPRRLDELTDEEILSCDGVFIPGGHGPMADLASNPSAGRVLKLLHDTGKTIAALSHGPAALLSAPDSDGAWLFDGYKMTAFTNEEEDQTQTGRIGMPWYLEDALKNRGAVFDDGDAAWASHVVADRNLITAQNPRSSKAGADALLKRLGA
jgi:putative intracellular protease/amidase